MTGPPRTQPTVNLPPSHPQRPTNTTSRVSARGVPSLELDLDRLMLFGGLAVLAVVAVCLVADAIGGW